MVLKEAYFLPENIESVSQEMLAHIQSSLRPNKTIFRSEHSALLVLDMQRYFLEAGSHAYVPSAPAILPGIQRLVSAYALRGLPVFFSRHVNNGQDAGSMAGWWRDLICADNPAGLLIPEIDTSAGMIVQKGQYDAFFKTDLQAHLWERNVRQVVIGGVMTHLCCESTARSGFMRGFEVFFLVDGTATYNRAFHQASLLNLAHGFACLLRVDEVLAALSGKA